MLSQLASWVETVIEKIGYLGVGLLVALENIIPVIPSEIVQPYAGFVAQKHGFGAVVLMVIVATIGSVVGSIAMYAIAASIGPVRLRAFVNRYGSWVGVSEHELTRAENWFDRRATIAVLVGRCVPLIRAVVSIPAGFRRMKLLPYIAYSAIGSLVWNILLIGAGALLGDNWERVGEVFSPIQKLVELAVVVAVVVFAWSRVRPLLQRKRAK
ncbi:MAG: DedA family protein [Actinomycetota bacterium]